jgi:multidrug efflux pump subunit AcrA (membrane-fusion protein)
MHVRGLMLLSLLVWTLTSSGCQRETGEPLVEVDNRVISVATLAVHRQSSFSFPSTYYGRIEPARRAALSFELAGLLTEVLVDEGGQLAAGQPVARLDTSGLEADRQVLITRRQIESTVLDRLQRGEREEVIEVARAEVKRREVDMQQKEADRGRAEKVYEGLAISKSDYDQAVFAHESARYSLQQARTRLEELETGSRVEDLQAQASRVAEIDAQLQRLKVQFEKSVLVSPFNAICVKRHLDEGVTLSPGQAVVEVHELNRLEARFSVPQPELDQIAKASSLVIGGRTYPVQNVRVLSQVDQSIRAVDVVIPIESSDAEGLLPGQTGALKLNKCVKAEGLTVPITALVPSIRGLWSCYRLRATAADSANYLVEKVEVNILHINGVDAFVASSLDEGDLIIPTGVHKVVPGMLVRQGEAGS